LLHAYIFCCIGVFEMPHVFCVVLKHHAKKFCDEKFYSLRLKKDVGRVILLNNPYVILPEKIRPPTDPLSFPLPRAPPLRRRRRRPRRRCSVTRVDADLSPPPPDAPILVIFIPADRRRRGDQGERIPFANKALDLAAAAASSSAEWARCRGVHALLGV
jgi:hypothetical protein